MHSQTMIASIRDGGIAQGAKQAEDRNRRLQQECGFRMALGKIDGLALHPLDSEL